MLVLTRKTDEVITLGDPRSPVAAVEVTVLEVQGDSVRLGITAPQETEVHRKEVYLLRKAAAEKPAGKGDGNVGAGKEAA